MHAGEFGIEACRKVAGVTVRAHALVTAAAALPQTQSLPRSGASRVTADLLGHTLRRRSPAAARWVDPWDARVLTRF